MILKFTRRHPWQLLLAIFMLLSITLSANAQNAVKFLVTSDGSPVKGISVEIEGITIKTNSSGEASIYLPNGVYSYMVYTAGADESIVIGSNTFSYFDEGGSDREDRYNNIFLPPTNITVSGDATENISLASTTFNTTLGGSSSPGTFSILADYNNRNGSLKTKTITTLTSGASATLVVPLPMHRDDRQENILSFDAFYTSDAYGNNIVSFDPLISPVSVVINPEYALDFTITAGGVAVEGIYVTIAGKTEKTDASGQVSLDLPAGTYDYSVFSSGHPESFIIGGTTYTYQDLGGNDDREDRYENIFVANNTVDVSGASSVNVALDLTTFKTKDQGVDATLDFDIVAEYSGGKIKTIAELSSKPSGDLSLPLPTHRSTRQGDTLEFSNFQYHALSGIISNSFTPASGLVTIDLPATHDVSFQVQAGAAAVEGISIGIGSLTVRTDASGQASASLPAGAYTYSVYTGQTPESITIGSNTFKYNDQGEYGSSDSYDNIFVLNRPLTVSGTATENIALSTSTFNTTVGGTAASAAFSIIAEYHNRNGSLKDKTITQLTSDVSGSISLPLPTHRDDRQGNVLNWETFYTEDSYMQNKTAFDPLISPVTVALDAIRTLDFTITAGGTAIRGIYVTVGGKYAKTDDQGQVSFELPEGTHYYSVYSGGDPESFVIGSDTYTYQDLGGRDDKEDRYDNIFVANKAVQISGASSELVDLSFTNFETRLEGVAASASFDVIAEYSGGKTKTIAELTSDAGGDIAIPLPTHRSTRNGDTLEFSLYQYYALGGLLNDAFAVDDDPVLLDFPALYETTFQVEAGALAVEGISIYINDKTYKTDAAGQVIIELPAGVFSYWVYTEGTPETISIGDNTFTYADVGTRGSTDSYENIFINEAPLTVSGVSTETISLATTSFQTTVGGTAASVEFEVSAAYINDDNEEKRKTITRVSSNESGTISLPLPTHRTDRQDNILEYYAYAFSDLTLSTQGLFDPTVSPVQIDIPTQYTTTFTVLAGSNPVQGMNIAINQLTATTDASGQAVMEVPEGEYELAAYTVDLGESLTIGGKSFTYMDMGGSDMEGRYDNIFYRETISVSGAGSTNISLLTPTFNTTVGGVTEAADFAVIASYINNEGSRKYKSIIHVRSGADGQISFPLPSHRTSREGPILEFLDYSYTDLLGMVSEVFDPNTSPVLVALPASNDVKFVISSGGLPVEGISVRVMDLVAATGLTGEVTLGLPDGEWNYFIYTAGKNEQLTIDGFTFSYMDEGGNESEWEQELGFIPNFYDNVFEIGSLDVSGAATENIAIGSTTFETTLNGVASPVSLIITGDYYNDDSELKNKGITSFSTGANGTLSLPLPKYRDDRRESILEFITYRYADISGTSSGIFNPASSPVQIAFGNLNTVTFRITNAATGDPVEGAQVHVNGAPLALTDATGEASTGLAAGTYAYTVSRQGYRSIESTSFDLTEATLTIEVPLQSTVGIRQKEENQFAIYPNPASELVTLRFAEPYSGTIALYSIMGSLVRQIQFESELSRSIYISNLESGMYIIKAGAHSRRLIIK